MTSAEIQAIADVMEVMLSRYTGKSRPGMGLFYRVWAQVALERAADPREWTRLEVEGRAMSLMAEMMASALGGPEITHVSA